jgi:hypothetical protein
MTDVIDWIHISEGVGKAKRAHRFSSITERWQARR